MRQHGQRARTQRPTNGFAVIYRWRVHPGLEDQFVVGWTRVTRAMHAACGSYGSRLHRAADGSWLAYARWPDAETRRRCVHPDDHGEKLMAQAVAEHLDTVLLDIDVDMLAEPYDLKDPS